MHAREIFHSVVSRNTALQDRVQELDAALERATSANYDQCRHAISTLRTVCLYLEDEIRHHFRVTEAVLRPAAERKEPPPRDLLAELSREHDAILGSFITFRHELIRFNASGELGQLCSLGKELAELLRRHVNRKAQELLPVFKELSEG